jgi:MFS transporter, ACS family, solute carrier family 17 (sodium-dependent inorganic phosphate cotransporter), member 5
MIFQADGEFAWDEYSQGIVLGSFFYGYVLTQIPGGRLAETLGGKVVYGIGVFFTAFFTMITPIAARKNLSALVLVRILEGVAEGVTFPSMHAMLARWVPKNERSRFAAVVYNGANFGTVISIPLTGYLCNLEDGWPLSFYLFGVLGFIWCIFWYFLVYDTPESHPRISVEERLYIQRSLKKTDNELDVMKSNDSVPWKAVFTSAPMWALIITTCGQSWVFYTQLSELPTYMSNILHFDIQQNAILSALPYLTSWIFGIFCSIFADWLITKEYISQKNSFKFWNSVASIVPSIGLVGIGWAGCDRLWVMFILVFFGAFAGANYAGTQMNHLFLAPRFAGTLYGISNGAGNLCGFLAPYFIGALLNGQDTIDNWKKVFNVGALINILGSLVFIAYADAEEQSWSKKRSRND